MSQFSRRSAKVTRQNIPKEIAYATETLNSVLQCRNNNGIYNNDVMPYVPAMLEIIGSYIKLLTLLKDGELGIPQDQYDI